MEKIAAPFDGKNLIDDSLRDEVFKNVMDYNSEDSDVKFVIKKQ